MSYTIHHGDVLDVLGKLPAESGSRTLREKRIAKLGVKL